LTIESSRRLGTEGKLNNRERRGVRREGDRIGESKGGDIERRGKP